MDSMEPWDPPGRLGQREPTELPDRPGQPDRLAQPEQLGLLAQPGRLGPPDLLVLPELPALPGLLEWRVPPQLSPSHRERR